MSIVFDEKKKIFTLTTKNTSYQMQLGPLGYLLHLYYGRRAEGCFDYLHLPRDCGFSANPYELQDTRGWSLDTMPQEYSGSNGADFRLSSLEAETESGQVGADLRYVRHEIHHGKYALNGLPTAFDRVGECESLSITLSDAATGLEVELLYSIFWERDMLTRAARIRNRSDQKIRLRRAASACLDIPFGSWELIHFHGRHTLERQLERQPLLNGIQTIASSRGASSHQHNPFVIVCEPGANEDAGLCYGMMLVYSGNHRTDIELDQSGSVRVVSGINSEGFSWLMEPGQCFETPELLLTCSTDGFAKLSHTYHRFLRENVCRDHRGLSERPILLNSWEAMYFDFDEVKLLDLAREAKNLGMDMLVIDDGWFGHRDDDHSSLGDWTANPRKLPHGLKPLLKQITDLDLKVGLWVEPEMVSEDSELYRAHPDWALTVPGRKPAVGRNQLVLDLSRREIVDWLYEKLSGLLRELPLSYIKWDMNRHLTDLYSFTLPADRQGEIAHRYVLGLYDLLGRLTEEFPNVLFEGCAGGGGRFDAGMLAYCPQIWCSDNTDPIARLSIQYGTSFGYPASSMGAHVSTAPNHQTGRTTPLGTRATVAMSGTFGYELDPAKLTAEEREEIRQQLERFRALRGLIGEGDYYRLTVPGKSRFTAWQLVSTDQDETLLNVVLTDPEANPKPLHIKLKGLNPDTVYTLSEAVFFGCTAAMPTLKLSGAALMYAGVTLPPMFGDTPSAQLVWHKA
ncbi:MAG: alpha-galactosidase [Oscillospiraceae bacterium]|nr:alpha-galactosidase [Oscillospiraceae bacterium]